MPGLRNGKDFAGLSASATREFMVELDVRRLLATLQDRDNPEDDGQAHPDPIDLPPLTDPGPCELPRLPRDAPADFPPTHLEPLPSSGPSRLPASALDRPPDSSPPSNLEIPSPAHSEPSPIAAPRLRTLLDLAKPASTPSGGPSSHASSTARVAATANVEERSAARADRRRYRRKRAVRRAGEAAASGLDVKSVAVKKCSESEELQIPSYERRLSAWQGKRVPAGAEDLTLGQVLELGLRKMEWDGTRSISIRDSSHHRIVYMGPSPGSARWKGLMERLGEKIDAMEKLVGGSLTSHRRGGFGSIGDGVGFGGGRSKPGNYAHGKLHRRLLDELWRLDEMIAVTGLMDKYLCAAFPRLSVVYKNVLSIVLQDNPSLVRAVPSSHFAAANVNFGRAVTRPHLDHLNWLPGQCAVLPVGTYDYRAGGHLVLWDLGLVLEFPPGTIVFLPSALLRHSNTTIGLGEKRHSITLYSAAGLFRWAHNGCVSDKTFQLTASPEDLAEWKEHRENLAGLSAALL